MNAPEKWVRLKTLFAQSLEQPDDTREAWLDIQCRDEPELRAELHRLLAQQHHPADIFAADASSLLNRLLPEQPVGDSLIGATMGPYRLTRLLGEGGMGRVYFAERVDGQFNRQVALKVIRAEFATTELHQRFLRERDTLARLVHPNIAQLYDGGVNIAGEPFFTLEFIEGEPLARWCDKNCIDIRARIQIMMKVCDAVQYAHRNLIVHRDLKPSNILVTATGEPKLLDFGIAKLLVKNVGVELTNTQATPMTREFAAPEQILGEPITTAADVYSLGVILYILLCGQMPYRRAALGLISWTKAILEEAPESLERAIGREVGKSDPASVANSRATSVKTLQRLLRGDLERIVQRTLAKLPEARYATVSALQDDLRAYLGGRALSGGTRTYRIRKFIRRHWLALTTGAALFCVVLASAVGLAWQSRRIVSEAATTDAVKNFLVGLFRDADPMQTNGKEITARELVDRGSQRIAIMHDQPLLRGELESVLGQIYNDLGRSADAEHSEQQAIDDFTAHAGNPVLIANSEREQARANLDLDEIDKAAKNAADSSSRLRELSPVPAAELARSIRMQAEVEIAHHRFSDAKKFIDEAVQLSRGSNVPPEVLADCLGTAAVVASALHDVELGMRVLREEIVLREKTAGGRDPTVGVAKGNLADLIFFVRPREAADLDRDGLDILESTLGKSDTRVIDLKSNYCVLLAYFGLYARAESMAQDVDDVLHANPAPNPQQLQVFLNYRSQLEFMQEKYADADKYIVQMIELRKKLYGASNLMLDQQLFFHTYLRGMQGDLDAASQELETIAQRQVAKHGSVPSNWLLMQGTIAIRRGDYAAAEHLLRDGLQRDRTLYGTSSIWGAQIEATLGTALSGLGRNDEAISLLRDAIAIQKHAFGDEAVPEIAITTMRLAEALAKTPEGRAEALDDARIAVTLLTRFRNADSPQLHEAQALLAQLQSKV
jgi:eukaryotic-like serine/threonine-protein kinase